MKKVIILLLLIATSCICIAQDAITFSIYQDAKLAVIGDNKDNDPFTFNMIIKSKWQGYENRNGGFMEVVLSNEYADLKGGYYNRYSGGVAYNQTILNEKFIVNGGANYGVITRKDGGATQSIEFTNELIYKLSNTFNILILNSYTQRTDLNRKDMFRYNMYIGIEYRI